MGGPLIFMAANRSPRMILGILDSFEDACFECLIVFRQFLHTLIGSLALRGQALRISGLPSTPCLLRISVWLKQLRVSFAALLCSAAHCVSASFWKIPIWLDADYALLVNLC
jgi:hypothetical protein